MNERRQAVGRLAGIGVAWGAIWLVVFLLIGATIGAVSPGSIDPGEPRMFLFVFGPMGLFSGIVFAALLLWNDRTSAASTRTFTRAVVCGFAATAIVQVAYLGHGDQGLARNLGMALLFSAIGAVVGLAWLALARGWSRWRTPSRAV